MTLNIGGGSARLAFAMLANGNAQFIEFDAAGGAGTIGSGTMEKADTTALAPPESRATTLLAPPVWIT